MTALIQLPNTPEIFAKVERRLAEAIHGEVKEMVENQAGEKAGRFPHYAHRNYVRELRGIRQALKDSATITVDAAFYWSLTNETATTQKPEIA